MAGVLVDTNILVYAYDPAAGVKRDRAIAVLAELGRSRQGRLSVQCLAEFFTVVTRPRRPLLSGDEAAARVLAYAQSWTVYDVTLAIVQEAIAGARRHRLNYWDAQMWAVARAHGLEAILSEDFAAGARLDGVRCLNPLVPGFAF